MKILQVITSLRIGGAEKLITEIAPLLRAKGHEVDILSIDGEKSYFFDTLLSHGFRVITLGNKCNPYHPKFIFKIIGIMKNYDIVHTHLTSAQLFVAIGSLFSRKPTLFTTEHNTTNRRRDSKLYWLFDKWMYSRYKKVICISDKTYENLDHYLPGMKNLCLIYNGVNIQRFRDAKALQEKNSTGKTIVTMVAAFRPQKDHKTLIKAMKRLPKERFELWIVGDGELHDQIHSYVEEMNMSDSVVFWGNRPDIPEILHASDIIFDIASESLNGFRSPSPTTSPVSSAIPTMVFPPEVLANAIMSFKKFSCFLGISSLNSMYLLSPNNSF